MAPARPTIASGMGRMIFFLNLLLSSSLWAGGLYLKQHYHMGKWNSSHQIWYWIGNDRTLQRADVARFWRGNPIQPILLNTCLTETPLTLAKVTPWCCGTHQTRGNRWMPKRDHPNNSAKPTQQLWGEILPMIGAPTFNEVEG